MAGATMRLLKKRAGALQSGRGPHQDARVEISGKAYSPPGDFRDDLGKLKSAAEDFLGEKVTKAVITVRRISMTRRGKPRSRRARSPA